MFYFNFATETFKSMIKNILRGSGMIRAAVVLMLVAFSISGISAQTAKKDTIPSALMYRISGNGLTAPSYIFGSVHTVPHEFVSRSQKFMEIAHNVQRIVTEIDHRQSKLYNDSNMASAKALSEQILPHIVLPADSQMQVIAPAKFHTVDSLLHRYHLVKFLVPTDTCWWHYEPGVFAASAVQLAMEMYAILGQEYIGVKTGQKSVMIDEYMNVLADSLHKDYAQLESLEYQKSLLPQIMIDFRKVKIDSTFINKMHRGLANLGPIANRANMLYEVMTSLDGMMVYAHQMLKAYMSQDGQRTAQVMAAADKQAFQQMGQQIALTERNDRWMKVMPSMMKEKSNLFVVGLLHLTSTDAGPGIVEMLKKAGYTIEPVRI